MSAKSRWLRINIDWDDSKWLCSLSIGAQLAWVKLLCHAKRDGSNGVVKALTPERAAEKFGVSVEDITALFKAARLDKALAVKNGEWIVTNWARYQAPDSTNNERQQRHRDRKAANNAVIKEPEAPLAERITGDNAVTTVTNALPVTRRGQGQGHKTPQPPKGDAPRLCHFLPPEMVTDAVMAVWDDYVAYRQEKSVPKYTERGIRSLAKQITESCRLPGQVVQGLEEVMAANYQGPPPGFWQGLARRTAETSGRSTRVETEDDARTRREKLAR